MATRLQTFIALLLLAAPSIVADERDRGVVTAEDRQFWSFRPLQQTEPPAVRNEAWCRTPVDHFILAKLEEKGNGLAPAPPAAARTLVRRACYDLTGLPPASDDLDAFEKSGMAGLVARLLASPHYGERWARHWLDLARYAESHGYEQDYDRPNAWHYRDFLIRAFNDDLPYDTFVRWQIAGDELAPDNSDAWKATGFLAAGTHATQITANQAEKERYDELDDMVSTIGTCMLGVTIGCARCHDHKYDPVPTTDYYRLISTFTTTVRSDYDIETGREATRLAHEKWAAEQAPLVAERDRYAKEKLPLRSPGAAGSSLAGGTWLVLDNVTATSSGGAVFEKKDDASLLAAGPNVDHDTYTFTATTPIRGLTAVRIEAVADLSLKAGGGPGRADNGNFALSVFKVAAAPADGSAPPVESKLINPRATFEQKGLPVAAAIDNDPNSAWAVDPQFGKTHAAVFDFAQPVDFPSGATLTFTLTFNNNVHHSIGRPRLAVTTIAHPPLDGPEALHDQSLDPAWAALNARVAAHAKLEPKPKLEKALVCSEGVPAVRLHTQGPDFYEKTFFLKRGDLGKKEGEAPQGFLQILTRPPETESHWLRPPPAGARTPMRRAALASWITDPGSGAGPLLARVIVNRLWQHHFGRGLVATPSDFGAQGDRPTHPELLDWLAGELIRGGWKLKPIHRLIMTSSVYQQASAIADDGSPGAESPAANPHLLDPENRLLWHFRRQRLEAEIIRDAVLAVSGTLDTTMFGPGTLDLAMKRRSVYFQIKRSQLNPILISFDAPDTLTSLGQRSTTTVAPQALILMNNATVRTAAQTLAQRLESQAKQDAPQAIRTLWLTALFRPPDDGEVADSLAFLNAQTASYQAAGKSDAAPVALADLCQSIMSLNEFVFVE